MSAEQTELHFDRINPEIAKWSRLEFARRVALRQINTLLEVFASIEDRDIKELLSHVISIGGEYLKELTRQKDSGEIVSRLHYVELAKTQLGAAWWLDALRSIYPSPGDREQTMSDLLQAAAEFLKETLEQQR